MPPSELPPEVERILVSQEQIETRVAELAAEIDRDYKGRDVLLVGVLKGAVMVMADLSRAMSSDPAVDWSGTVTMLPGVRPKASLPLMRQREVEVHRTDLVLGYGFAEMPADYVRRDLRLMGMFWTARQPMGMTALPEAALALTPAIRLAWLMGRIEIDGLAPANVF